MRKLKLFSRIIAVCIFLAIAVMTFAACGADDGKTPDGKTIIAVYRGRSSGMIDGSDDDKVTKAIEDKFEADTGIPIKLEMTLETNTSIPQKVDLDYAKKDKQMDLIFHYISEDVGSAILKYAKEGESVHEVAPLLDKHGSAIYSAIRQDDDKHIAEQTGYVMQQNGQLKMTMIPGVYQEKQYGILIRKDLMKQVQSKTGINPDAYDVSMEGFKNLSIAEFNKVLYEMKKTDGMRYPIVGYPWDIARVIAPTFGVDALGYGLDADNKLVAPQLTANFDRYVDLMYNWAKDGIWAPDSNSKSEVQMRSDFMVGNSGCFIVYPEINNLIAFHRQLKAANAVQGAEYMMLAPLADSDESGNTIMENGKPKVNGFLKNNKAFGGVILPAKSKIPELTVQFLNWMYEKPENYELCKYGIKGEHWIEGDPLVMNGVEYKTWEYPAHKYEEYVTKPPYSGMWELLPNINVSNRMRSDLMNIEKAWYSTCTSTNQALASKTEGVWLPKVARNLSVQAQTVDGRYVEEIRSNAWAGLMQGGKTPVQLLETYISEVKVTAADYLAAINTNYIATLAALNEKFA